MYSDGKSSTDDLHRAGSRPFGFEHAAAAEQACVGSKQGGTELRRLGCNMTWQSRFVHQCQRPTIQTLTCCQGLYTWSATASGSTSEQCND